MPCKMDNFRLCRICISESAVMMSIFGEDALWRKIAAFANVLIEEDDILPQQICMICAKDAINACEFKQKCEDADRYFRLQFIKREKIDVIELSSDEECPNNDETVPLKIEPCEANKSFQLIPGDNPSPAPRIPTQLPRITAVVPPIPPAPSPSALSLSPISTYSLQETSTTPRPTTSTTSRPSTSTTPPPTSTPPEAPVNSLPEPMLKTVPLPVATPLSSSPVPEHRSVEEPKTTVNDRPPVTSRDKFFGHQCHICDDYFAMKTILKHHIKQAHPEVEDPKYECLDCNRVYNSKRFLDKHVRAGTCKKTDKPAVQTAKNSHNLSGIRCAGCNTEFPSGHHLGWHKRSGICEMLKTRRKQSVISVRPLSSLIAKEANTSNGTLLASDSDYGDLASPSPGSKNDQLHLDENQLALAKSLVLRNANIQQIAAELNTSEECALRLRNSISGLYISNNDDNKMDTTENDEKSITTRHSVDAYKNKESDNDIARPGGSRNLVDLFKRREVEIVNDQINPENEMQASSPTYRKPRKPSVFMDEVKYEQAKILVANRATTIEVAQKLNISQMSAWKIRQCILKGIELTFRKPAMPRPSPPTSVAYEGRRGRVSRPRLKGADRIQRDQEITKEILDILKEDNSIQYWRISNRLAEKGFHLTPPSICMKLKSMGIRRRWRQSMGNNACDENEEEIDMSTSDEAAADDSEKNPTSTSDFGPEKNLTI